MRRPLLTNLLVLVGIIAVIIAILLPTFQRMREIRAERRCPRHLQQIGYALLQYTDDHGGQFPDRLEMLPATQDITFECFVCPVTGDKPLTFGGPTTQGILDAFDSGKHLSYIYLRPPVRANQLTTYDVVVYEPLSNHRGDGSNVLYADGRVNWLNADVLEREIAATKEQYKRLSATRPIKR